MYAFIRNLRNADHTRRYTIRPTDAGWEVRAEEDSHTLSRALYQDWHRVEHARRVLVLELTDLQNNGWQEVS